MLSNFFVVLSTFAIIAGVVLIVNIFVMLAEERKAEMGMARAVGMKRAQLTRLFLFEGSFYAAGAALVGVFAGIGIAYAILYFFGTIITTFFPVNLAQVLTIDRARLQRRLGMLSAERIALVNAAIQVSLGVT